MLLKLKKSTADWLLDFHVRNAWTLPCQPSSFRFLWPFNYHRSSTLPGCASSEHHWKFTVNYNQLCACSILRIFNSFLPSAALSQIVQIMALIFPFRSHIFFLMYHEKKNLMKLFSFCWRVIFFVMIIWTGVYFKMSTLIFRVIGNPFVNVSSHLNNSGSYIFDIDVERGV